MSGFGRYARQVVLPEIGRGGQERISRARILCVGAGGLGCPALTYLAAAGVGRLGVVDPDVVDETNLQRQVLFGSADLGRPKAEAARERLLALNPGVEVLARVGRLDAANALELLAGHDCVVDGTDNFAAKYLINDAAARLRIPVVFGSISGFEGRVGVFDAGRGACYRCLYPEPPKAAIQSCAEGGVVGAIAGIVGSMQALEALKLAIGGALRPAVSELVTVDGATLEFSRFRVERRAACPVCSVDPEAVRLREEAPAACSWRPGASKRASAPPPGAIWIDVREAEEWREGHVPGAIHWPLSRLERGEQPELPAGSSVVFYCQGGVRSARALTLMPKGKLASVGHLEGGLESWSGPVTRGE
jgi:adenylyltransferase/sulfurtransferase